MHKEQAFQQRFGPDSYADGAASSQLRIGRLRLALGMAKSRVTYVQLSWDRTD